MTSRGTGAGFIRAGAEDEVATSGGERQQHPRLYEPFPVLVRGVDAWGKAFEIGLCSTTSALLVSICGCRGASRLE